MNVITENAGLVGGKPVAIREFIEVGKHKVESAGEANGKKRYKCVVSWADRLNANLRVYPKSVLEAEIRRLRPMLKDGALIGCVDHIAASNASAGNLKDACLIFRDLVMREDGAVVGEFEIVPIEPVGVNLEKQIKAGMQVGFSTLAYASAHAPTTSERTKYGIGQTAGAVVINSDLTIKQVDCVSDPSCVQARLLESREDRQAALMSSLRTKREAALEKLRNYGGQKMKSEFKGLDRTAAAAIAHGMLVECHTPYAEHLEPELAHRVERDGGESAKAWLDGKLAEYALIKPAAEQHEGPLSAKAREALEEYRKTGGRPTAPISAKSREALANYGKKAA